MKIYLFLVFLASYFVTYGQLSKISSFINDAPFERMNSNKATAVGSRYFFSANEGGFGNELWVNDGSSSGTYMVKDITSGPNSTVLSNFVSHKGLLYFFANGGITGEELWRSDGTANGTYIVKDVNSVNSNLLELISDGRFLYFFPFNNQYGNEIWKSDGTADGTQLLKDIAPGQRSSDGHAMFIFKNKLHFFAKSNSFDAVELWTSDGTSAGTTRIKLLNDDGTTIKNTNVSTNDSLFYFAMDVGNSDQLWISDGKNSNTKVIKNMGQSVAEIVVLPNHNAVFTLKTGPNLDDIWISNGTSSGTKVLLDLNNTIKRTPFSVITFKEMAYILGNDKDNCLLVKTDGTPSNTKTLSKFLSTTGTENEKLIPFENEFFVIAFRENISKIEMFSVNEFENSLRPIILNNEFNGRSPIPSDFRELSNNNIIFKADDEIAGRELFLYKSTKPLSVTIKINNSIDCFGAKEGILEAVASGGNPPYTYSWSNGEQSKTIQKLPAGNYTLSLTDSLGYTVTSGVSLIQPSALMLDITSIPETLYQKDGTIDVKVTGGTGPYVYLWNTSESISKLNNKTSGFYTVTVTDFNKCNAVETHFLSRIGEFPLNALVNVVSSIKCYGDEGGALEANPLGGVPPYTLYWSTGSQSKLIQNLSAGNYALTIIDSTGSTFIATTLLTQPAPLVLDVIPTPETLYQKDGALEAIVTGGTMPYEYRWNTTETASKIINKASGTYSVTSTDSKNCTVSGNGFIDRIGEFPLSGQVTVSKTISCFDGKDGVLEALPTGGVPPYLYIWSNGAREKMIQNLSAGNYTVTIIDSLGRNYIANIVFGQPSPLKIDLFSTPEILYSKNGTIEAIVSGGTLPYSYLWNTSETTKTLLNKASDTYAVTVTDNNSCVLMGNHYLNRVGAFPLAGEIRIKKEILCFDDANGALEAIISGGIPPYSYKWADGSSSNMIENVTTGQYVVTVTDSLDYMIVLSLPFMQPAALQIDFQTTPDINGLNNGSIQAFVSGGTPPYRFNWSTSDTIFNLSNLAGGIYSITVTDHNNCLETEEITIETLSEVSDLPGCVFIAENMITTELTINTCHHATYTYHICDVSGRILADGQLYGDEVVSVSHLMDGMYLVYILNENRKVVFSRKVFKM